MLTPTHLRSSGYFCEARENGAKIVRIRACALTAAIADQWIPIKAQTDPALALGMMNVIISKHLHAKDCLWLTPWRLPRARVRWRDAARRRGEDAAWMVRDTAAGKAVLITTERGRDRRASGTFEV